jgi:hypothetical protein
MLSVAELIAIMMCVVMLSVVSVIMLSVAFYSYDACRKAKCHYDERRYADYHRNECHYAECRGTCIAYLGSIQYQGIFDPTLSKVSAYF